MKFIQVLVLLTCITGAVLQTNSTMPNEPPVIEGCPAAVVQRSALRDTVWQVEVPLGVSLNFSGDGLLIFEVTLESSPPLQLSVYAPMDMPGDIRIILPGPEIPSAVNSVQINLTLTVTDTENAMAKCNFTVEIELVEADTCSNQHPPLPGFLVSFTSVTVVLDTQDTVPDALRQDVLEAIATILTQHCSNNCGECRMSSVCATFLEVCSSFTVDNILLITVSSLVDGTGVSIGIRLPDNSPLTSLSVIPVVPTDAIRAALLGAEAQFQAATGLGIVRVTDNFGLVTLLLGFDMIAAIVLPIVVILAVAALVVGIIVTVVAAKVIKAKRKKNKVNPDKEKKKKEKKEKKEKEKKEKKIREKKAKK